jgi:hypothetical protein
MTAGASPLQTKAFQGIGNLTIPSAITDASKTAGKIATTLSDTQPYTGATFTSGFTTPDAYKEYEADNQYSSVGDYEPGKFDEEGLGFTAPTGYDAVGKSFTDAGVVGKYMNPYLQAALTPTLQGLRRESDISRTQAQGRLAQAGAYGGARQAILEGELNRNLLDQIAKTTGEGYSTAFGQAANQFNTEQQRAIQEAQFGAQQGMTSAELAARYGLDAAKAAEQSRQFGAQRALEDARAKAQYGLSGLELGEKSKQFGAQQGLTAADLAARYGQAAKQAEEQSKQFGATYGLDALSKGLQAAQVQGQFGLNEADIARKNLEQQLMGGAQERGIEQEGITADLNEFLTQRDYPQKQVQFLQSMLQGLPISTVTNTPAQMSGLGQLTSTVGGIGSLLEAIKGLKLG